MLLLGPLNMTWIIRPRKVTLWLLALSACPSFLSGADVISSDRKIDWSNAGVRGGIPARTTIYATLSPIGGPEDDTPQIQAKINSCPSNQVVLLSTGKYNINSPLYINKDNVTLRLADSKTVLHLFHN